MQTLLTIVLICVMAFVALVGILIFESKENGIWFIPHSS